MDDGEQEVEEEEEEEEECSLRPPPRRAFADGKAVRRLYRELGRGDLFADPTTARSTSNSNGGGDRSGAAAPGRSELVYWAGPGKALKLVRIASLVGQRKLRKYIVRGTYIYIYIYATSSTCSISSVVTCSLLLCYWKYSSDIFLFTPPVDPRREANLPAPPRDHPPHPREQQHPHLPHLRLRPRRRRARRPRPGLTNILGARRSGEHHHARALRRLHPVHRRPPLRLLHQLHLHSMGH